MKKVSPKCEKTHALCVIDIENLCKLNAMKFTSMAEAQPSLSKEDTDMNDKSILECLFRQHYSKMIHLARTLLHDDAEAQDNEKNAQLLIIPDIVHGVQMFKLFMFIFQPVKRWCKSPFRYDCCNYRQHHKQGS